MSILSLQPFRGVNKALTPSELPRGAALEAKDAVLRSGDVRPIKSGEAAVASLADVDRRSLFRYRRQGTDTQLWMTWTDPDVRAVMGPLANDAHDRVYWTGDDYPRMASYGKLTTGGTDYPVASYRLGVPAPVEPPQAALMDHTTAQAYADVFTDGDRDKGVRVTLDADTAEGAEGNDFTLVVRAVTVTSTVTLDAEARTVTLNLLAAPGGTSITVAGLYGIFNSTAGLSVAYFGGASASDDDLMDWTPAKAGGPVIRFTGGDSPLDEDKRLVDVAYVYTLVTQYGEEGPPSPATAIIQTNDGLPIDVTMPTPEFGDDRAFDAGGKKRLYRANAGSETAAFQFVAEQDFDATAVVTDTTKAFALGEALPSEGWLPPPDDDDDLHPEGPLEGLVELPGGVFAGHTKRTVYFSVPGLPHAWPPGWRQVVERDIVALAPVAGGLAVLTDGQPYLINGQDPSALVSTRIEFPQGCLAARTVVDMGDYSLYCTPDGLARIDGTGARLISRPYLMPEQWAADYQADKLQGFYWEGAAVYLPNDADTDGDGFIYDAETDGFASLGAECGGGWADPADGSLYLIQEDDIKRYGRGDDNGPATWKSHPVRLPEIVAFTAGYVSFGEDDDEGLDLIVTSDAETYRLRVTIPSSGTARLAEIDASGTVTRSLYDVPRDPLVFRLPDMPGYRWQVEVRTNAVVRSVHLTDDPLELAAVQG